MGWVWLILLCLVGAAMCVTGTVAQDEGELLAYARLMLEGWMPYSQIWMMYPPGTLLILAALVKVGLPALAAEKGLGLGARVVYVLCVNRSFSGSWWRISLLGMPVAFLLALMQAPDSLQIRAYPWFVGLPFLYVALVSVARRPQAAAVLVILSGMFRIELAASGLIALTCLVVLSPGHRRRYGSALVLALAGLVVLYGLLAGLSGGDALRQIFVEPAFYVAPKRSLPLFLPQYSPILYPLALVMLLGPFVATLLALRWRLPEVAATNLALLPGLSEFVHRADTQYLFWSAAFVVPWLLWSTVLLQREGVHLTARSEAGISGLRKALYVLVVPGCMVYLTGFMLYLSPLALGSIGHVQRAVAALRVSDHGRTELAFNRGYAAAERRTLRYLDRHSTRGDTIFVAPAHVENAMYNATDLYFMTKLRPASRYMEMNPGVETRKDVQQEIIRSLRKCRWVVIYKLGYWHETSGSQHPGAPYLADYIRREYRPVLKTSIYTVQRRKR